MVFSSSTLRRERLAMASSSRVRCGPPSAAVYGAAPIWQLALLDWTLLICRLGESETTRFPRWGHAAWYSESCYHIAALDR